MLPSFTPFGQPKKEHSAGAAASCDCGCVPAIMSLHEQAKERARRRAEKAAESQRKPTVAEYLAMQDKTTASTTQAAAAAAVTAALMSAPLEQQKPPS
jgi:hypothetical protein